MSGYGRMRRTLCHRLPQNGLALVLIDSSSERRDAALAAGYVAL